MYSKIYCCGNTQNGELGLGGIEQDFILKPHKQRSIQNRRHFSVVAIASGRSHTLFLMKKINEDRKIVLSCGSNDRQQLGRIGFWKRIEEVSGLENQDVSKIACGTSHSLVLTELGQIFSWGSNIFGQLGLIDCRFVIVILFFNLFFC